MHLWIIAMLEGIDYWDNSKAHPSKTISEQMMYSGAPSGDGMYFIQQFIYADGLASTPRLYFQDNQNNYRFIPFVV